VSENEKKSALCGGKINAKKERTLIAKGERMLMTKNTKAQESHFQFE